jgi:tRNA(adenine34) deaminase
VATDDEWMLAALELAQKAAECGEVPVGAIVVCDEVAVGRAYNRRELDRDPLAHAEILALRQAAMHLDRWRLSGCTLYVTLEPCTMCAGAVVNARIDRVVFGAADAKAGAAGSLYNIAADARLNHRAEIVAGVRAAESVALLREFFAARRS